MHVCVCVIVFVIMTLAYDLNTLVYLRDIFFTASHWVKLPAAPKREKNMKSSILAVMLLYALVALASCSPLESRENANEDELLHMMDAENDDDLEEFARFMSLLDNYQGGNSEKSEKEDETEAKVEEMDGDDKSVATESEDTAETQGWRYWKRRYNRMRRKYLRARRRCWG